MTNSFVLKLARHTALAPDDRAALLALSEGPVRHYEPRTIIVSEDNPSRVVRLILSGWVGRHKHLVDGRMQAVALLLPGDLCDHGSLLPARSDHAIQALTPVSVAEIAPAALEAVLRERPVLAKSLQRDAQVDVAILRQWIVTLGCRAAIERLAHLFCEVFYRLRSVGLTQDQTCEMPLTQTELADATGITSVHVNRMLQELRKRRLVELRSRQLAILDLARLQALALFDPSYLSLPDAHAPID